MIYHTIQPHRALAPLPKDHFAITEQQDNEVAWSQLLVSRILPLVLPPEDLLNPCLHVLVSEIFSEMIVHNAICGRASEPWLLWEGVTKLVKVLRPDSKRRSTAYGISTPTSKLEQFGLLSSVKAHESHDLQTAQRGWLDSIAQVFWSVLQITAIAWLLLRSFTIALMHASSIPARHSRLQSMNTPSKVHISAVAPEGRPNPQHITPQDCEKRPVVGMRVWTCVSRLTAIELRMPWVSGVLSLIQWLSLHGPGGLCKTNSVVDR